MAAFSHILVPTDFGEASDRALATALELAPIFDARVTLMHATLLPPNYTARYIEECGTPTDDLREGARRELEAAVAKAKQRWSKLEGALLVGDPWARILEAAKEHGADVIIMGTHGRRGVARAVLGSIAEKIVRLSPIPVMTVSAHE